MVRFSRLSALLCAGMVFAASQAQAGFEFAAPRDVAPAVKTADSTAPEAPMPIAPTAAVTAEPLAPGVVSGQPVLPEKPADPAYIRRERTTASFPPPANEAMDSAALLKATENMQTVALSSSDLAEKPAAKTGKLVINPYPLEGTATHNSNGMGTLSVEQAMMEEGGTFRPVATPGGGKAQGLRARAQKTSRYDPGARYLDRSQTSADYTMNSALSLDVLTPIPGGEGTPLTRVESQSLKPPSNLSSSEQAKASSAIPQVSSVQPPVPLVPTRAAAAGTPTVRETQPAPAVNGFADAVGFGRDLPLALALSQVVPPEYSYAFGKDINVGTTVSWQGGKPWNEVLNDMLVPNGMHAVIDGNRVVIEGAQS